MNKQSPVYSIIFMLALCVVFGFGISFVNYATLPLLKKNESLHKNRLMSEAFMLKTDSGAAAEDYEKAVADALEPYPLEYDGKETEAYRNRENGDIGFIFSGFGLWDRITGIIVMSADMDRIRNIRFLEQKETPGLGSRIEEGWFTDQFKGLSLNWEIPAEKRIIIGQSSGADVKNSVDAITGATQTSLALMDIINSELNMFIKSYKDRKDR